MVTLKLESILGPLVYTFLVSQKVCVWCQLTQNRPIGHDLSLDSIHFLSQAEVYDSIEVVGLSACVLSEMLVWTLTLRSSVWIALLRNKTLLFAPSNSSVTVASLTSIAGSVAVKHFLG